MSRNNLVGEMIAPVVLVVLVVDIPNFISTLVYLAGLSLSLVYSNSL